MANIITFTNQKGGVGKTSLAMNFGVRLRMANVRVLMVDMDPQCSLTYIMGVDDPPLTMWEVLQGKTDITQAIVKASECDIVCDSPNMSMADVTFTQTGKVFLLRNALEKVQKQYDFIIIDSPPTLGILTVNILAAANNVIVPALADVFSLQGIGQLYSSIQTVRQYCNPELKIQGIILSRHSDRMLLSRETRLKMKQVAEQVGARLYNTAIRESVTIREAEMQRQSLFQYAPRSRQANDYEQVVAEFLYYEGYVKGNDEEEKKG